MKTFFSEMRAEAFAEQMKKTYETVEIWSRKDGFGQTVYDVMFW